MHFVPGLYVNLTRLYGPTSRGRPSVWPFRMDGHKL